MVLIRTEPRGVSQLSALAHTAPCIVNIVNFVRKTEPRIDAITDDILYKTTESELASMLQNGLNGTFLLQYDALIDPKYQELMRSLPANFEVGAWWEITQPHVEAAGMTWRGRYPWDWHANVGFATGYTPQEREKLVDAYMKKFKDVFGKYPASVGSWFIDAHTLKYLADNTTSWLRATVATRWEQTVTPCGAVIGRAHTILQKTTPTFPRRQRTRK